MDVASCPSDGPPGNGRMFFRHPSPYCGEEHDRLRCRFCVMRENLIQRFGYIASDDLLYALDACEVDGVEEMLVRYAAQYGAPMVGSTRAVFDTGDGWVIKIPLNWDGICANSREADWTNVHIPLAPCHIAWKGDDQPVLRMQRVMVIPDAEQRVLPSWVAEVDCAQVGYLPDGRLVAFDL